MGIWWTTSAIVTTMITKVEIAIRHSATERQASGIVSPGASPSSDLLCAASGFSARALRLAS
jgi:hypothetical protein